MAGNVQDVSDQTFETSVLKSDKPVLVDFWAPWCGPCRAIAPVVEEMANEYAGKVSFVKLNTDDNQNTAMKFGIMAIPTLLVFQNGAEVARIQGAGNARQTIKRAIEGVIGAAA